MIRWWNNGKVLEYLRSYGGKMGQKYTSKLQNSAVSHCIPYIEQWNVMPHFIQASGSNKEIFNNGNIKSSIISCYTKTICWGSELSLGCPKLKYMTRMTSSKGSKTYSNPCSKNSFSSKNNSKVENGHNKYWMMPKKSHTSTTYFEHFE